MKNRSPDQTVVSISLPKELLAKIDARASSLGMPRSQYLARLAKSDVDRGGAFKIEPGPEATSAPAAASDREVAEFLEMAVPALADYQRQKDDPGGIAPSVNPPESLEENEFWNDFLDERDEILRLKWIDSKEAGHDIGFREAIRRWLEHRSKWQAAHHPSSIPPS